MPWITTKEGKHINTDWFDEDEKRKEKQIAKAKEEADSRNDSNPRSDLADKLNKINDKKQLQKDMEKALIPKDSYINSEEYKQAVKENKNAQLEKEKRDARIKELDEIIKNETISEEKLTRDDFDTDEEFAEYQLMHEDPRFKGMFDDYTEKGKAAQKEKRELLNSPDPTEYTQMKLKNIRRREGVKQRESYKSPDWKTDIQSSYKGFELDTHTSYYQDLYKEGKAEIVEMSPEQYLKECAYNIFPKQGHDTTYENQIRVAIGDASSTMKLVNLMQAGTKMYMPALDYKKNGQEGRHRAVAAMILGIKKMPVMIVRKH